MKLLMSIAIHYCLMSAQVFACSCGKTPSVCSALGEAEHVFTGTVVSIKPRSDRDFMQLQVKVDRIFKGDSREQFDLFDDGMCDGPVAYVGARLLIYTKGISSRPLPLRGCSRTRLFSDAVEDLELLTKYTMPPSHVSVVGNVVILKSPADQHWQPVADIVVQMTSESVMLQGKTDSSGRVDFSTAPPGRYKAHVHMEGFHHKRSISDVVVPSVGCESFLLVLEPDLGVAGVIVDHDGQPMPGLKLELVEVADDREPCVGFRPVGESGRGGGFRFSGLRSAYYRLGVNICSPPSKAQPYAPTYYPGADHPSAATLIAPISKAGTRDLLLKLPRPLQLVTIDIEVSDASGRPLPKTAEVRVNAHSHPAGFAEGIIALPHLESGKLSLELCQSVRYFVFAEWSDGGKQKYSRIHIVDAGTENASLALLLSLSSDEFDQLRSDMTEQEMQQLARRQ